MDQTKLGVKVLYLEIDPVLRDFTLGWHLKLPDDIAEPEVVLTICHFKVPLLSGFSLYPM